MKSPAFPRSEQWMMGLLEFFFLMSFANVTKASVPGTLYPPSPANPCAVLKL